MPKTLERPAPALQSAAAKPRAPKLTIYQTATQYGAKTRIKAVPGLTGVFTLDSPRSNRTHRLTVLGFAKDGSLIVRCSCLASGDCWHIVELRRRHARKKAVRPYEHQIKGLCLRCGEAVTEQQYSVGGSTSGRGVWVRECWSYTTGSGANGVGTVPCTYREVI